MTGRKFSRGKVRLVTCDGCGKLTTSGIDGCVGLNLCRECFNDVNGENAHSDYGHDEAVAGGDYWPRGCEKCRAAAEDAKIIATFKAINAADHKRDAEEAGEGR